MLQVPHQKSRLFTRKVKDLDDLSADLNQVFPI